MNAEQLAEWLQQNPGRVIPLENPDSRRLEVSYVFNWGGFCNQSFRISDGSRRYHLKITSEPHRVMRLRRWQRMHVVLEQRYRAPKLIDWVDLPEIGFAGLLFEHIDGRRADFCRNPDLLSQIIDLVDRFHADAGLRSDLASLESPKTYSDFFLETYIDRFTADLEGIKADPPPFITSGLMQWMNDETLRLREKAVSTQVFHVPAIEPVHADLHEGNVMVTSTGWSIVDWDDLALGDPALELTILIWPLVWQGKQWQEFVTARDNSFAERMQVCLRAQLLDEVIDNIADYVEAESVPSRTLEVQRAKKRRHEEALRRYSRMYGVHY